jgi:carnitine-CoA ligase
MVAESNDEISLTGAADRGHPSIRLPAMHPFVGRDLWSELERRAQWRPNHPFVIWDDGTLPVVWTYQEFIDSCSELAAGLDACGVQPGERVAVMLENCPESISLLFACARLGAVCVILNPASAAPEVEYFIEHSDARLLVTQTGLAQVAALAAPDRQILVTGAGAAVDLPLRAESLSLIVRKGILPPRLEVEPGRDLCVQYTSGTTSRPKGVVWTHANALWAAQVNARHTGLRPEDVYLVYLPLFHTNALSYSVLGSFWVGATVVVMPKFSASRFWDISLRHRCTVTSIIPFVYRGIASQPVPQHHYRVWGSPLCDPPFDAQFHVKSVGWWGMTETVSHGIVGDVEVPNAPMSCGRPALEYEIKVTDDSGWPVAVNEAGALSIRGVRGLSLFSRYLNDPDATDASFDEEGFFGTGDRVKVLPDGHIQFMDRDKDMLKVGGENVAASEIERVAAVVPGVSEVAVVGRRDDWLGEVPVAFVIQAGESDDALRERIITACQEQLASFKVPREVIFVEDFPRSTLNKIVKARLRDLLNEDS